MILRVFGRLPGLNELLAGSRTAKGSWNQYNSLKQQWYGQIKLLVTAKRIQPVGPGYFTFMFVEPNKKRDPDNIVAGGVKLLLDSLVGAEVLAGDGWSSVIGFVGYWTCSDRPGCLIVWDERQTLSKTAMQGTLEREDGENAVKEARR